MERVAITALSALALLVSWQLSTPGTPAIYDGICTSDPYRYVVNNPVGSPQAMPARETIALVNGQVPTIQLTADNDNNPQAEILVLEGSIQAPAGSTAVTLTITPLAPPSVKPATGHVDGNMYNYSITTSDGKPVSYTESPTISLRSASRSTQGMVEYFDGHNWKPVKTSSFGCADTLAAAATTLGDYAVVVPNTTSTTPASPDSFPWGIVSLLVALAGFALVLVVIRRGRGAST